jgi:hypothetical protein
VHLQNEEKKDTVAPPVATAAAAVFCREATVVPHPRGFCGFPHPNRPRAPTFLLLCLLRQTATACAPPGALVHHLLPCLPSLLLPLLPTRRPLPPLPRLPLSSHPCLASLDLEQERRGLEEHATAVKGARGGRRWSTRRLLVEHAEAVGGERGSAQPRRRRSTSGAAISRPAAEPS